MPLNPPAFPNFEFVLPAVLTSDEFAVYHVLCDGQLVNTAVVSYDSEPPVDIIQLKEICKCLHIMAPTIKISHMEDCRRMSTLVYQPFTTLSTYINNGLWMDERDFAKAIKDILQALFALQEGRYISDINTNTVVISENGEGSILLLKAEVQDTPFTNADCFRDSNSLWEVIDACAGKIVAKSENLDTLLNCMLLTWSKFERLRLLQAPFFCEDSELVNQFIEKVNFACSSCKEYRDKLKSQKLDTARAPIVRDIGPEEMQRVLDFDQQNERINDPQGFEEMKDLKNDFALVRFTRNCFQHLNHHWNNISWKLEEEAREENARREKEAERVRKEQAKKARKGQGGKDIGAAKYAEKTKITQQPPRPSISPLMANSSKFVEIIRIISRQKDLDIFNRAFVASFGVKRYDKKSKVLVSLRRIPMLDED